MMQPVSPVVEECERIFASFMDRLANIEAAMVAATTAQAPVRITDDDIKYIAAEPAVTMAKHHMRIVLSFAKSNTNIAITDPARKPVVRNVKLAVAAVTEIS